jgi:beta-1,4-N-acetylglucosaminyltransferase
MSMLFIFTSSLLLLLALRYIRKYIFNKKSIMIILGSGGHTGELLIMLSKLNLRKFEKVYFVSSHNDTSSENKAKEVLEVDNQNKFEFLKIYRSRNVGQSYFTSIFTTLFSMLHSVYIMLRKRPNMVILYLCRLLRMVRVLLCLCVILGMF